MFAQSEASEKQAGADPRQHTLSLTFRHGSSSSRTYPHSQGPEAPIAIIRSLSPVCLETLQAARHPLLVNSGDDQPARSCRIQDGRDGGAVEPVSQKGNSIYISIYGSGGCRKANQHSSTGCGIRLLHFCRHDGLMS